MTPEFLRLHRTLLAVLAGLVVVGGGGGALAALHTASPVHRPPTAHQSGLGLTTPTTTATPSGAAAVPSTSAATGTPLPGAVSASGPSPGQVLVTTATPYPTKPAGMPQCQDADFGLQVRPEQSAYSIRSGQRAAFDISLTYHGKAECNGYLGTNIPLIRIYDSQGQLVYKDVCGDVCPSFSPKNPVYPEEVVGTTTDKWDETQCSTDQCAHCQFNCPPRPPVGPGTYTVVAVAPAYKQSPTASFQLTP